MNKITRHPFNDQLIACIRQIDFSSRKSRNQDIILDLCGLNDGHPKELEEVSCTFNITKERVRQIKSDATAALTSMQFQYPNLLFSIKYLRKRQAVSPDVAARYLRKKDIIGIDDNLNVIIRTSEVFLGKREFKIRKKRGKQQIVTS